ncbi:MAG TPA: hypothetical protein VI790_06030, partial [Candidatus Nanoarchaeia archaeon]|nr:hypothetical protein [Candidatus Nanoarchaeia archaeon]
MKSKDKQLVAGKQILINFVNYNNLVLSLFPLKGFLSFVFPSTAFALVKGVKREKGLQRQAASS